MIRKRYCTQLVIRRQEIYDFLISELDAITNDLPVTKTYGRPCKWAALALKSRAALYASSSLRSLEPFN